MSTAPLLAIDNLSVDISSRTRTVHALDGVSLRLDPGEALGIVGESGCGKTMTALSVLGLLPPGGQVTAGSLTLDGTELAGAAEPVLRGIRGDTAGAVFQDPMTSLNPTMTIGAQVAEPLLLHRDLTRRAAYRRAEETLRMVGMPRPDERMRAYPHQLSGGMRQRVAIAMALVCEPRLLIADEPTTALDVTTQHQILELIDDLRSRLGMAMILVTHDLGVVANRVDRVAVMYAGEIVETSPVRALFARPRHRYTEALLAALPERVPADRDGADHDLHTIPGLPPSLSIRPTGCRFAPRCVTATEQCRYVAPELLSDERDTGHRYACFHPVSYRARSGQTDGAAPPEVAEPVDRRTDRDSDTPTEPASLTASSGDCVDEPAPLLELDTLGKDFPLPGGLSSRSRKWGSVSAVRQVSLTVRQGETFGMVGESGCGKTTLGRIVAGLEGPTAGTVRFAGRDVSDLDRAALRRHRRQVQLMFQDSTAAMDPRMRIGTVLREPLVIQGVGDRAEQERLVAELLDSVGLPRGAVHRYPHEFSGGQRQRLGLARALALSPDLVVADEPVSALDVSVQAQILNLMRELQRDRGLTYLFISHDLAVVRYLADTVGVMYLGALVETGPAEEVYTAPLHPYTRGLLDTVNVLPPSPSEEEDAAAAPSDVSGTSGSPLGGETPSAAHPPSGCRFRTRCPIAQEVCARVDPKVTEPVRPGHRVACHFPLVPSGTSTSAPARG